MRASNGAAPPDVPPDSKTDDMSYVICTDDNPMPILGPGNRRTKTARMWVYVGDGRNSYAVFDFTTIRSHNEPATFLSYYGFD